MLPECPDDKADLIGTTASSNCFALYSMSSSFGPIVYCGSAFHGDPHDSPFRQLPSPANLGLYNKDIIWNKNTIRYRLFKAIITDHVLVEISEGAVVGGGGKTDLKGVEIVKHLFPQVVDAPVTFINHYKVKKLRGQSVVIDYGYRLFGLPTSFIGVFLLCRIVQLFTL